MNLDSKIYVAGHQGMVGSAILRKLKLRGFNNIITKSSKELDLTNQEDTQKFLNKEKPDFIFIAAAKVGGIYANDKYPADFIYKNLMIQNNLIYGGFLANTQRILFLGSSCIYPKDSNQPISEEYLLSGYLEKTNEPYAIAKIAGIKLCESFNRQFNTDFRSVMPTNLYGINDNYHPENSHVIPSLIRKFHEAKVNNNDKVEVWGSGKPKREFLFSEDLAEACIHIMNLNKESFKDISSPQISHINIGSGQDISIANLAEIIRKIVGFKGEIIFNQNFPDGTKRKLLDIQKILSLGWSHSTRLEEGLKLTYKDYQSNYNNAT